MLGTRRSADSWMHAIACGTVALFLVFILFVILRLTYCVYFFLRFVKLVFRVLTAAQSVASLCMLSATMRSNE